jgi:hypothetical protein
VQGFVESPFGSPDSKLQTPSLCDDDVKWKRAGNISRPRSFSGPKVALSEKWSYEKAAYAPVSAYRLHRACALFLARSRLSSGLTIAQ